MVSSIWFSGLLFGALGDIHGSFVAARQIVEGHRDVPFWLCVGDVATDEGRYEPLGGPVYWIHGNNENFDAIASGDLPEGLHYLPNGTSTEAGPAAGRGVVRGRGIVVAALGGTFAPTWYETPASALPHPRKGSARATELADKRRHFVRGQVEACAAMRGVDVLLTHEAASPFRPVPGGRGPDAGKRQINLVLQSMQPRLHLFGHHHRFSEQVREGVRSVGLDLASRSYLLIDDRTFEYELHGTA